MNREEAKTSAQTDRDEIAKLRKRADELRCDLMETIAREQRLTEILPLKEAFAAGKRIELIQKEGWCEVIETPFTLPADQYRIIEPPPRRVRDLTPSDLPDHPWFKNRDGVILQPIVISDSGVEFGDGPYAFRRLRELTWEFSASHKGPWSKCEVSE